MATAAPAAHGQDETAPPWRWREAGLGLAVVALIGGVTLRVVAPSPLWLDEALSVHIASLDFSDMVEALRHDGHPSLYYLLLGFWIDVFGDSNGAARALSGVMSLATVPVLWAIGRRRSPQLATVAALGQSPSIPTILRREVAPRRTRRRENCRPWGLTRSFKRSGAAAWGSCTRLFIPGSRGRWP